MNSEWQQIGTVEILRLRIYPIDPQAAGDHTHPHMPIAMR